MILSFNDTAPQYGGRVDGTVILRYGTRGVARTRSRPANSRQRQAWHPPWLFKPATVAWFELDALARASWVDAADNLSAWPIQGSPRYTTAQLFFENYYTVLLLVDEFASVPDPPTEEPSWQERPKFWEFAEWVSDIYTLKAETEFAIDTHLLFSGLPPSRTVFNGEWFGEKIIGNEIFYSGLTADEEYDGTHYMIENAFGTIDNTMKIWGRVWEIYPDTGFIRVLKDPCTIDPTEAPAPTNVLNLNIYNDYVAVAEFVFVYALTEGFTIGQTEINDIYPAQIESGTITLDEGYELTDIEEIELTSYWFDGEDQSVTVAYNQENPFPYSIEPD